MIEQNILHALWRSALATISTKRETSENTDKNFLLLKLTKNRIKKQL